MNQYWQKIVVIIDIMSERKRIMVFAMLAIVLNMLLNAVLLDPVFAKKKQLAQRLMQERGQIATIHNEIQQKMQRYATDPDQADRARLQLIKQESVQLQTALRDMQKGLVAPEKMSVLLEDILKRNGRLRLVALKTISATSLNEPDQTESQLAGKIVAVQTKSANKSAENSGAIKDVYKHGVEITLQGGYLDLMAYMTELESMPWQLYWGKVNLNAEAYPKVTLTLTLFTLSLDKKWLAI